MFCEFKKEFTVFEKNNLFFNLILMINICYLFFQIRKWRRVEICILQSV
jgi:hypothetical protein